MRINILLLFLCAFSVAGYSQSASLPYYTGFDSPAEKAGWQQYRMKYQGTAGWGMNTVLFHDYNVGGHQNDTVIDWMVSPPIHFIAPSTISMKVKTGGFSPPTVDNCEVWFSGGSPDPGAGDYVLIGNISYMQPRYQWLDTSFSIPFMADSGYIAYKYKTIYAYWSDYTIDSIWITTPAGVADIKNELMVIAFPNPISSSVSLKLDSPVNHADLVLYNISGQEVKRMVNVSGNEIIVDCEDLDADLYFFQFMEGSRKHSYGKLVVNR